jgi:molybdopterin synthase catalytic subunit
MTDDNIWIEIVDAPIEWTELTGRIADPDAGAHGWFVGVTRRTTHQRVTESLAYEAHVPMAMSELEKLARTALQRFSLFHVVIIHRIGEVPVGEASVVVGCSSSHRPQTFEALAWIMDTLKREVPIWKRERYEDGSTEWIHPTASGGDLK